MCLDTDFSYDDCLELIFMLHHSGGPLSLTLVLLQHESHNPVLHGCWIKIVTQLGEVNGLSVNFTFFKVNMQIF